MPNINYSQFADQLKEAMARIVESQLTYNDPPDVQNTLNRLMRGGKTEEEAKAMIGALVSIEVFDIMKNHQPFNHKRYLEWLHNLPTMPWD